MGETTNSKVIWWIMGIGASIIVLLVCGFVASFQARLVTLEQTAQIRAERVSALESASVAMKENVSEIKSQLLRIETKIDELKRK